MRLGIKQKMFLVMLIGVVVLVLSMSLFVRWSFQRGFLNYVQTIEQPFLVQLEQRLQQRYQEQGSWTFLRGNEVLWRQILHQSRDSELASPLEPVEPAQRMTAERRGKHKNLAARPRRAVSGGLKNRLQLLDVDHALVVGVNHLRKPQLHKLYVQQQLVGFLAHDPPTAIQDVHQLSFVAAQKKSFGWIALFTVATAALLSLPLAHRLVKRLQVVAQGTSNLASGDYSVRIPVGCNDELGHLADNFNSLASTLQKNEQVRRAWVADISHELRTPLTVLRGELEALQDGVREFSPHTVDVLHSEVVHLGRLVDDLYELSMSDAGALTYNKILLAPLPLITACVELFKPRFAEKNITLQLQCTTPLPAKVLADPERLQQLLTNLLENSLRYTDSGGRVELEVAQRNNELCLQICDSAPGVPQTELPRLFERLYRGESSRNRASGGRGLGLSICQNIVAAHDGTIDAQPATLGGLCVRVHIPLLHTANHEG
ncbi:MAG: ATP-binding protein [Desulfuromonas sp.]|nr:ATP-binding protein [Desulfuromonas sp.]